MTASAPPQWLTSQEQSAWRALAAVMFLLPGALDRQLRAEVDLTHATYLILAMLSEADGGALRMNRLAQSTNTSFSRLSHTVTRLEQRGWVQRRAGEGDKRGQLAMLTEAGYAAVAGAAPGHVAQVRRLIFEHLTPAQVVQLTTIMHTVTGALLAGPDRIPPGRRGQQRSDESCPPVSRKRRPTTGRRARLP